MQIPKPDVATKEAFRRLVPDRPGVEVKAMFGNLGAFVNGNMFAGLFGASLGVRVFDDADHAELAAIPDTGAFGPTERPMGRYVALPPTWIRQPDLATT